MANTLKIEVAPNGASSIEHGTRTIVMSRYSHTAQVIAEYLGPGTYVYPGEFTRDTECPADVWDAVMTTLAR